MGWATDDRSKLERDIVDFRQMRFDKFGVSKDRVDVALGENFNMAIRELRGAEGGTSINPLADDDDLSRYSRIRFTQTWIRI